MSGRLVSVTNDHAETVPSYGIMKVTDVNTLATNIWSMNVTKPDGSGTVFYPNSKLQIPTGETRTSQVSFPAWVSYTGGPPTNGDEWGPVSGSWDIQSTGTGFRVIGVNTTDSLAYVKEVSSSASPSEWCFGEIVSVDCVADPHTAVVQVLNRPCGTIAVTGEDGSEQITVYDRWGWSTSAKPNIGCSFLDTGSSTPSVPFTLIGRGVYCVYGEKDTEVGTCKWFIAHLCCPDSTCSTADQTEAFSSGFSSGFEVG